MAMISSQLYVDASNSNIATLLLLMLIVCLEFIFWIREGDKGEEKEGGVYLVYRVSIRIEFITRIKSLSISSLETGILVEEPLQEAKLRVDYLILSTFLRLQCPQGVFPYFYYLPTQYFLLIEEGK